VQDWHALATVMREVARGLAYMHTSGRIHRDLKAANILVAPDGRVCLAGVPPSPETTSHETNSQPYSRRYTAGGMRYGCWLRTGTTNVHEVKTACFPSADFGVSAALEATPGHDGASQSQHQPGAQQAFDAAAHMRRVSVQQQANSKVRLGWIWDSFSGCRASFTRHIAPVSSQQPASSKRFY
jgi:serine/threonine protein kinase